MKKLLALCLGAVIFSSALLFLPTAEDREIYSGTLRLHVLADSDDEDDQARKLSVRDAVLALLAEKMEGCEDASQAKQIVLENEEEILQACRTALRASGCEDDVTLSLSKEYYPTRHYEDISLPAGQYLSLRVMIGQAKGKNWWCVLYPPVCMGACQSTQKLEKAGFSEGQINLVKEEKPIRYKVKFKIMESVERWLSALLA